MERVISSILQQVETAVKFALFLPIHSSTTAATSRLFSSKCMKCPFPLMPTSSKRVHSGLPPACARKFAMQWSYVACKLDSDVSKKYGTEAMVGSLRAGSACR